jgi:peroxiredoxin
LEEFSNKNKLNFTLVSDTSKEISENYDVKTVMPGLENEIANRAIFLVKDGKVIYEERMEDPTNLPDMEKLKEDISKAQ